MKWAKTNDSVVAWIHGHEHRWHISELCEPWVTAVCLKCGAPVSCRAHENVGWCWECSTHRMVFNPALALHYSIMEDSHEESGPESK